MSRDILKQLTQPTLVALRCKGDAWPRGVFAPTLIPDTWMGLREKPDGRRRFVPAGEDPQPDRDDTLVLVRNRAITVPLEIADALSATEHAVSAAVEILLRWPARDDDLAALHRTLLSESDAGLTLERLAEAVSKAGALSAVRSFIRAQPAAALVHDDQRAALLAHFRGELQRFLFGAGLTLERLGRVEFTSASLAEQEARERDTGRRVKELEARNIVERTALAATQRRLDDLSTILGKLKAAAAADGSLQWRELLPTLTPGERGRLLENLWRLTPDRAAAQAIVVVTGHECVWLDPQRPEQMVRQVTLPDDLGGLRSIRFDPGAAEQRAADFSPRGAPGAAPRASDLLVGAGTGVWRIDATSGEVAGKYGVRNAEPTQTGFNAAVVSGGWLFATHSRLGCWGWPLDDPQAARPLLQPSGGIPKTIRAATATDDGHILFAAGDEVHVFTATGERRRTLPIGRGAVHDIAVLDRTVYVTTSDGLVLEDCWDAPNIWQVVHRRSGPIETIFARRWDDLVELVIPAGTEGVCAIYPGEGIVARLLHVKTPIRRAWACDDALVALADARDRLFVLNAAMPERAGCDVPIARLLGHAIQDACIVLRHEGT